MPRRSVEAVISSPEEYRSLSCEDADAWPLLVAFDLDYTLWDLWIDTHISPPLKRAGDAINILTDRAREALDMLLLQMEGSKPIKAVTYFNTMEIYPGQLFFYQSSISSIHGVEIVWWFQTEALQGATPKNRDSLRSDGM
ncbi:MAG: hypothetical protein TREMPRED_004519 [Tremellales sp. Tagirdzhanova-0007]|nr:MAG: hypothetical protein TREMPRED_004519 [Tremellales sp. Tagirdzhanova-0007]